MPGDDASSEAISEAAADAPAPEEPTGLTEVEAARRLAQYGENALTERRVGAVERLAGFFWGPIPWMIEVAAILSAAVGRWEDFAIIVFMLLINAGVGFLEENNASNAIAALKQRLALEARALPRRRVEGRAPRDCSCPATSSWSSSAISCPPM